MANIALQMATDIAQEKNGYCILTAIVRKDGYHIKGLEIKQLALRIID